MSFIRLADLACKPLVLAEEPLAPLVIINACDSVPLNVSNSGYSSLLQSFTLYSFMALIR